MYFSKITLKQDIEKAKLFQILCPDEYKVHQHLWTFFGLNTDKKRDFLYRRDETSKWPQFYMLSPERPQDDSGMWKIMSKDFNPQLSIGQHLSFSLVANPIVSRTTGEFRKTDKSEIRPKTNTKHEKIKRDDIIWLAKKKLKSEGKNYQNDIYLGKLIQEEGRKWLQTKSPKKGFEVKDVIADNYRQIQFFKKGFSHPIKISTLRFTGVLSVVDPELFILENFKKINRETSIYEAGIGPAKAFGCGLMLIKKV